MSAHHNPGLDGWYTTTSSSDYKRHGAPVMGPWVEQLDPKLPGNGLLHRVGMPDVKVRIIWNTGCQLMPSGAAVCKAFVREMGPADLIRFRLPNGHQGRALAHKVYTTPRGALTDNPRVIATETKYKKAWLPASYTDQKPSGISGTWVQVTPASATVGLVHIPGIGSQQAYVLQVKNDAWGRPRALVQWKSMTSAKRQPNAGATGSVVVTTSRETSTLRDIIAPGSSQRVSHDLTTTRSRSGNPGGAPQCRWHSDGPGRSTFECGGTIVYQGPRESVSVPALRAALSSRR